MSNTLTARVKLDISDAERKLSQLERRINKINNTLNNSGNSGDKINQQLTKAVNNTQKLDSANKKAASSANNIAKGYKNANSAVSVLTKNMRTLISTYVGIMGAKSVFGTSDAITSAQNKVNYVNDGKEALTQEQMLKTYAAAQRSRGDYMGMLGNVSKTMTLAGDAFQDNVDNAIRFQEIMSKAYTVGGASAAEQASSMYQLVQALGSGILQGDELRSVREGAPIAYKEIEKFAQGVYKTEESLKDLASQGKITSDIVVAAMMNAGDSIDKAFNDTEMTFAQALTNIKNMAVQAFTPVLEMLNNVLNSNVGQAIINGIGTAFVILANAVLWVMEIIGAFFNWCSENWYWLQWVVFAVASAIVLYLGIMAAQAIITGIKMFWAFLTGIQPMYWIIIIIGVVVGAIVWLANTTASACEFICGALLIVALAILTIGIITGSTALMIVAIVVAVVAIILALFMTCGEQIVGIAFWLVTALFNIASYITSFIAACVLSLVALIIDIVAFIVNCIGAAAMAIGTVVQWIVSFVVNVTMAVANAIGSIVQWIVATIVNLVMGCANSIVALSHNAVAGICNVVMGLLNTVSAVAQNIGIAFQNAFIWANNAFWEFIADVLSGVSKLEPVINGIAKLIGKGGIDLGGAVSAARSKKQGYKSFVSVGNAWSSGMKTVDYKSVSDGWSKGWNTMDYVNIGDMVSKGWNTMDYANMGDMVSKGWNLMEYTSVADAWSKGWNISERKDLSAAYDKGAKIGGKIQDTLNSKVSALKDKIAGFSIGDLTNLFGKLGDKFTADEFNGALNTTNGLGNLGNLGDLDNLNNKLGDSGTGGKGGSGKGSKLPNPNDPALGVGGSYDPSNVLKNIKDDVGTIADSVDLTEDDLEYLRKIADMEWKKEFTTATIHVDMSNYNTVNGDSDLDGIVTRLADKLYEELDMVANGVYA